MRNLIVITLLALTSCAPFDRAGTDRFQTLSDYHSCRDQADVSSGQTIAGAFGGIGALFYAGTDQAKSEKQRIDSCMISKGYTPGALDF